MKFGFVGGTNRGLELFKELLNNNYKPEFCAILKEDDHENVKVSGDFLELANKNSITASVKKKLLKEDYDTIKSQSLDFIIVCGWRTLIDPEINSYLKLGLIAAHDSLLPKYRGFAPLNWAIINGENKTGVSLFVINDGEVDSGNIISQEEVSILKDEYAFAVYQKIISATINCYLKMINSYKNNGLAISLNPQDENEATYTCKRTPEDGKIDWSASSSKVFNLIRALAFPYSGAFFFHNNQKYEVRTASLGPQNAKKFAGIIPGRIIGILPDGVEVLCAEGTVLIKEIYDESSKSLLMANQVFKSITVKLL